MRSGRGRGGALDLAAADHREGSFGNGGADEQVAERRHCSLPELRLADMVRLRLKEWLETW